MPRASARLALWEARTPTAGWPRRAATFSRGRGQRQRSPLKARNQANAVSVRGGVCRLGPRPLGPFPGTGPLISRVATPHRWRLMPAPTQALRAPRPRGQSGARHARLAAAKAAAWSSMGTICALSARPLQAGVRCPPAHRTGSRPHRRRGRLGLGLMPRARSVGVRGETRSITRQRAMDRPLPTCHVRLPWEPPWTSLGRSHRRARPRGPTRRLDHALHRNS